MVLILLAMIVSLSVGCGGSGDGSPAVPDLEGEEAVQAVASASVSLADALVGLLDPVGGEVDSFSAVGSGLARASRGASMPCAVGGTVDVECREADGRSIVRSETENCGSEDESTGIISTTSGVVELIVDGGGFCGGPAPINRATTIEFRNYREDIRHRDGAVLAQLAAERLRQRLEPLSGGCSPNQALVRYDGDYSVVSDGIDVDLELDRFELRITSGGNPCAESAAVSGRMEVRDRRRGSRFWVRSSGLGIALARGLDGAAEVIFDGDVEFDCAGPVTLATSVPLALGGSCPIEGQLLVDVDTLSASVVFGGDVSIDYDRDGAADVAASSCDAAGVTVCR